MSPYLVCWTLGAAFGAAAAALVLGHRHLLSWASGGAIGLAWFGLVVGSVVQYRLELLPFAEAAWLRPQYVIGAGMRLPLGMAVGGGIVLAWALACGLPWRDVGDALAVGAFVTTAIGRIGCIVTGCCLGRVCPTWLVPVCIVPPAGTEAFLNQTMLQGTTSPHRAVVPLSWLFLGTSAALMLVLVALETRRPRPGKLLAVACIVGPLGKALLESLRDIPRSPIFSIWMPLAVSVTALVVVVANRRTRQRLSSCEPSDDRAVERSAAPGWTTDVERAAP